MTAAAGDEAVRIAIVTDAWEPQVNGVVRTLQSVRRVLESQGHQVLVVSPENSSPPQELETIFACAIA